MTAIKNVFLSLRALALAKRAEAKQSENLTCFCESKLTIPATEGTGFIYDRIGLNIQEI